MQEAPESTEAARIYREIFISLAERKDKTLINDLKAKA